MLIGQVYFKGADLVLRDVDGSEVSLSLQDALDLGLWLQEHRAEMLERILPHEVSLAEHLRNMRQQEIGNE